MKIYIIVYEDKETGNMLQWQDADIKTEFLTYDEAMNYIINIQPVGEDLDIMAIERE